MIRSGKNIDVIWSNLSGWSFGGYNSLEDIDNIINLVVVDVLNNTSQITYTIMVHDCTKNLEKAILRYIYLS